MRLILKITSVILLCHFASGWMRQGSVVKKNKEGERLYNEDRIDEALAKWRDAQIDSPDKKELHYNIGGALHQQKKYEEAFGEYEKSLDTKDAELQAKAYYNMGNTDYRMGKLPEAIGAYKKALDINPDDEDAKYNIEFIRKKLKEDREKKERAQEDMKQDEGSGAQAQQEEMQEDKGEGQKEQASREGGTEEGEGGEEERSEMEAQEGTETSREQRTANKEKEGEMSEEDAIRLLDALKGDEKDLQKGLRTHLGEGRYRVDKDW